MITLTYHAIAETSESLLPSNMAVSPIELEKQICYLLRHHTPAEPQQFLKAADKGVILKNAFLLTFDDGHKGQHDLALDILEKYELQGVFFVPTGILEDRRLPTVERQRLLQYCNGEYVKFYQTFTDLIATYFPELERSQYLPTTENLNSALSYYSEYHFYSPMERLYRKVRETMLPNDVFEKIIDAMFQVSFEEEELIEKFFLNWDDVSRIAERGHSVGGHGHAHLLESNIRPDEALTDHAHAIELLNQRLDRAAVLYAYPYGIFCEDTVGQLMSSGIRAAFTCQVGHGWELSPMYVHRFDCKTFPFEAEAPMNSYSLIESGIARL